MPSSYQPLETEAQPYHSRTDVLGAHNNAADLDDNVRTYPPSRLGGCSSGSKQQLWIRRATAVSLAANFLALLYIYYLWHSRGSYTIWRGSQPLYTPIEDPPHKLIVSTGLRGKTPYHGPPSPDVDMLWENLYAPYLLAGITAEESSQLANATALSPGLELYETQIEVFHYLHCLNFIRQLAWPTHYGGTAASRYAISRGQVFSHADHCINAIREALMCNSPIAALPWQFNPAKNHSEIRFDVLHTCSDFSAVQEAAKKRQIPGKISTDPLNATLPPEFTPTHAQLVAEGWED